MLPILVNERDIEPTVIKKANQFISFKFGDIQLLDIMNFIGGATSLDSFLKAYKTSETKRDFSPTTGLITLTNCRIQNFPHMTPFTVNFVAVTLLKPNERTIEVPESLRENFANFLPIFRNTFVSKSDTGNLIKNYAEEERLLSQPRKMLIPRFTLQN